MLYPGQAVFAPKTSRLGIYLGYTMDEKYPTTKLLFVYVYAGKGGEESTTLMYEEDELEPISIEDDKALTGQTNYKSSLQRDKFSRMFTDQEAEQMKGEFLKELKKLLRQGWLKKRYSINTDKINLKKDDD